MKKKNKKFNLRNFVAKNNKHKGGKHKSKKDYDMKYYWKYMKGFMKMLDIEKQ